MTPHERRARAQIEDAAVSHDAEAEYFAGLAKSHDGTLRKTYQRCASDERCLARALRAIVKPVKP